MRAMFATSLLLGMPLIASLALGGPAASAPDTGRFVHASVRVGHESHRYAVWLPPGHDARKSWPGILFLHGSGECGTDGEKPLHIGFGPALAAHPDRWPFVVVFPQKAREDEEWEENENLVFKVLDDAIRHFAIDRTRVALAGMSQGGHGAWMIGARHPGPWKCLVPICGYGRARTIAPRVARLPVWAFHGLQDDLVDPADTRRIIGWMRGQCAALGVDSTQVHMTLFPDANHDAWDPAFAHDSLNVWLKEQLEVK